MVNHFRECRNTAVMHVGRGHGDVSQRGRPELADVFTAIRVLVQAGVRSGILKLTANIVKAGVLENTVYRRSSFVSQWAIEVPTAVALEAAGLFAGEKQYLATFCRIGDSIRIVTISISVVGRVH